MQKEPKTKPCGNKDCENTIKVYNSIRDTHCSAACKIKDKGYPLKAKLESPKMRTDVKKKVYIIPKRSKKKIIEDAKYTVLRIEFLGKPENRICPITKQPTIEVHHTYCGKDRAKYYLDVSTWIAVSRDGHNWIHDNPKEARELGYLK